MWASVWAVPSVPLVQAKTTIPSLPRRLVARERLHDELTRLIGDHRLVEVLGAAGAGKTTAGVDAVREL
jgi:ATP/maltotriose-dependent transcriptional regulator MalT